MTSRPAFAATLLVGLLAGCATPIGAQPVQETTLQVEGTTVVAGGNETISIVATNVDGMSFDLPGPPGEPLVDAAPTEATSTPRPDVIWGSGTYTWSTDQRRVSVELPIHVPSDARAGRYRIEITARDRSSGDGTVTVTKAATVRVVDGRGQYR